MRRPQRRYIMCMNNYDDGRDEISYHTKCVRVLRQRRHLTLMIIGTSHFCLSPPPFFLSYFQQATDVCPALFPVVLRICVCVGNQSIGLSSKPRRGPSIRSLYSASLSKIEMRTINKEAIISGRGDPHISSPCFGRQHQPHWE